MSAMVAVLGRGLVDPTDAVARADDAGLTRGDGCFEGCRLPAGAHAIAKLDAHLARMSRSAAALQIPFDEAAWRALVAEVVEAWTGGSAAEAGVKLLLTRGTPPDGKPVGLVTIAEVAASALALRRTGLRVVTLDRGYASDVFVDRPWLLGGVKSLSYAVNMAAQREAARRGADDVVFVSTDGIVLEAPTASVVWAVGRTLHTTPAGATGILAGTTQQLLFDRADAAGWATAYTRATVDDLHAADVVWLVGSVRGPVDIVELDGKGCERNPAVDAEIRRLCGFDS